MYKTAECVSPMHPDKICDRISDAILDECLSQDPYSRVAIETMGGHGIISITGELTTNAIINIRDVAKKIVGEKYGIQVNVVEQSPEISRGVDIGGAGDQGIMVGYACNENEDMIPQEMFVARNICNAIFNKFPFDGKTQVTIKDGVIVTIVASFQNTTKEQLKDIIENELPGFGGELYLNPTGDWFIGGFDADTGVTGRKLAVDNYGPSIPIGGGAFSGKDPSKVDRSGAYKARQYAVKYLKSNDDAKEVFCYVAYVIGKKEPVMVKLNIINKNGTKREIDVQDTKEFEPNEIIKDLNLRNPIYSNTATFGHFRNGIGTWN